MCENTKAVGKTGVDNRKCVVDSFVGRGVILLVAGFHVWWFRRKEVTNQLMG